MQIASGVHPDFIRIGRAPNRSEVLIEQVREMIARLGIRPSSGAVTVAIIDDAETLGLPAENALLKTLEEPPGHAIIFMVTDSERALLETVRSRMRPVHFGPLAPEDVEAILASHGHEDRARNTAIARLARGSAAAALRLCGEEPPPMPELINAIGAAPRLDFAAAQKLAQDYFKGREEAALNFELIARLLEEILCLKLLGAGAVKTPKPLDDLANKLSTGAIVRCLDAAIRAKAAIDAMANPRLQAEQYWMTAGAAIREEAQEEAR